ncbi:gas vesicle accessory protein GvpU [Metabacillus malikii]|uniref:Gas vesicle protein GvpU n=1 Tax=Metabacillus malikii TaxID=1504265 RepID=A0ABT9ZBW4_9BACI|nr:gas vesicle accessory protein GvpU [Metabacillus malikii]MDQ0229296.1 hypothetical protein [Metabacillus malikii]
MADKEPVELSTDDAVLLMFLRLVEEDGVEVKMTVSVSGAIISGTLIGATAYYDGITESAKSLYDNTMSKIISKKFNDLKEAYAKQKDEDSKEESEEFSPSYIHLKDARYFNGTNDDLSKGTWWRGKVSSVDGFSFDSLT